jgi:hypothetical protein
LRRKTLCPTYALSIVALMRSACHGNDPILMAQPDSAAIRACLKIKGLASPIQISGAYLLCSLFVLDFMRTDD